MLHIPKKDSLPPTNLNFIDQKIIKLLKKFSDARQTHIGYPYNLNFNTEPLEDFNEFLINNLGNPYVGSHYATEVCEIERETVDWAMKLWGCEYPKNFWGTVGAGGTEGNIWAIYLAREALCDPVLVHSADAHYSISKAAKILGLESIECDSDETGAIRLSNLRDIVTKYRDRSIILTLTCGTTMKGAYDDIEAALSILDQEGIPRDRRFVHVDGALNAMVLPFVDDAPSCILPTFKMDIDSISTSGHKMIGTPMPCGLLDTRQKYTENAASRISYLRSDDTTLMGSRSGHAVLAIWNRFMRHGHRGFSDDANNCIARAAELADALRDTGADVLHNPWSLTAVFPKPSEWIVNKYQLACDGDLAHAIVMPNVTQHLLDRFVADYRRDVAQFCLERELA